MDRDDCSRMLAGRIAFGAQRDVECGTGPLCVGAAHRGSGFVSATEGFGINPEETLARA